MTSMADAEARLLAALEWRAGRGRPVRFWLRDDDAVEPSSELDRFLALASGASVPVTLAVIPEHTGPALAERLAGEGDVTVALHGWSHRNHAPATEKKQELGAHRPPEQVLAELKRGMDTLGGLHGERLLPVLVPPWNRIAPALVPQLAGIGLRALSVFGPEKAGALPEINTHVDVIDWHGTRGGRDCAVLLSETALRVEVTGEDAVGILTHHLVHDATVDRFLRHLFTLTSGHHGCRWVSARDLL